MTKILCKQLFVPTKIMMRHLTIVLLTLHTSSATAQNKMRQVEELINKTESGWVLVNEWIKSAKNKVEVLPVTRRWQKTHCIRHK
jgi:hypothetical protein